MAQVIGYVKSLQNGAFLAKDAQGHIRELKAGDQIFKDELVYGAENNPQNAQVIIDVTLTDAKDITLSGTEQLYTDLSVIGGTFEKEDAVLSSDSLENAWKLSTNTTTPDTTTPLDATAAGIEAPAAGQVLTDTEHPSNTIFYDRTGAIGDVRTVLTQDTLNGGIAQNLARIDTPDLNDQPIVASVTGTVNEAKDGLNTISGQLVASDPDVGDTHTFFAVSGTLLLDGKPAPEGIALVLNTDGTYSVTGDFNHLAVGENAVVTFQYYAVDNGIEAGAPHASLPATVTITIQGTNDQPVINDINVNGGSNSEVIVINNAELVTADAQNGEEGGEGSNSTLGITESTITIAEGGTIADLNVHINLDHTYDGDLTLYLIAPDGTKIKLTDQNGDSSDNYTNTTFDSEATTSITNGSAPFTGTFKPEGDLSVLNGMDIKGVWTLQIVDNASEDTGILYSWSIDATVGEGKAIYETSDPTSATHTNDGNNVLSGALSVTDDDATDTHTFKVVDGSIQILDKSDAGITLKDVAVSITQGDDGTWQYKIDGDFSKLAAGEKATLTFQYVADDGHGFDGTDGVNESSVSVPKTITLTITGTNDQPVVSDVTLDSQNEAITGTNTFGGTLLVSDADVHDTHTFHVVENSLHVNSDFVKTPALELNAQTGEYTVTGDFNALAVGESATVTFQYYAQDNSSTQANGESNTSEIKMVTMTITGTNDVPVITSSATDAAGTATEAGNLDDGSVVSAIQASGTLVATDADHNAELAWSGSAKGTYGSFAIDPATGKWTYTVDDTVGSAADKLKEGDKVTEKFTVVVTDDQGATATQVVTITVNGTNDAPVIAGTASGDAVEAGVVTTVDGVTTPVVAVVATGTLSATDVDHDATHLWSGNAKGTYGSFAIDAQTGKWTYTAGEVANQLAEGETKTETFKVTATDDKGAIDTQDVTITIHGTNDAPVLNSLNALSFSVQEDAANEVKVYNGDISIQSLATDADHGATLYVGKVNGALVGKDGLDQAINLTYTDKDGHPATIEATLHVNQNGSYVISTTNDLNPIPAGAKATATLSFTIADEHGAESAPKTVNLAIEGANDAPVVDLHSDTYAMFYMENGDPMPITSGADISISDVDSAEIHSASIVLANAHAGDYLVYNNTVYDTIVDGKITVDIHQPAPLSAYQDMIKSVAYGSTSENPSAEPRHIEVTVNDGHDNSNTATTTIHVMPVNDAAIIAGKDAGAVTEDMTTPNLTDTGKLTSTDVDGHDNVFIAGKATSSADALGSLSIDAQGNWTYTVDNSKVQYLSEGEIKTEIFTVKAEDGTTHEVVISIVGTNDAPVIAGTFSGNVVEDGQQTATGTLSISDVDTNDNPISFVEKAATVGDNGYGSFSLVNGTWTYTLNNASVQSLAEGEKVTDKITFTATDGSNQEVSVTITGTNDAPVFVIGNNQPSYSFNYNENSTTTTVLGTVHATDVDKGSSVTYSIVSGNEAGYYAIDSATGEIKLTTLGVNSFANDFEAATNSHSLVVGAYDGTVTTSINVTLNEQNVNDNPVVLSDANNAANTVAENAATGTVVGVTALGTDADAGATIAKYELTNNADGRFSIDAKTGVITVADGSKLDYESATSHTVTVQATSSDGSVASGDFTINVAPVADAPTLSLATKSYEIAADMENVPNTTGTMATPVASLNTITTNTSVWQTDNLNGYVEVDKASTYGGASSTNHVIELEHNSGEKSNLYTQFAVKTGEVYTLSFDYAARSGNMSGTDSEIDVYWNGEKVQTLNTQSTNYTHYALTLLSETTGTGTLEFRSVDSNSLGGLLDNIDLTLHQNAGYAGYLTNLPEITAALTDSSETLSLTISGIPDGYTLTDGTHISTLHATTATVTDWDLKAISLVSPSNATAHDVTLHVTATSTESDGSSAATSQDVEVSILADSTGFVGTTGADNITGDNTDNVIWGLSGNDVLNGGNGNDVLMGGAGNDILNGGAGNDILNGGTGNDTIISDISTTSNGLNTNNDSTYHGINGGDGIDILQLSTDGSNIDFSVLNTANMVIQNIEVIDLGSNGTKDNHKLTNLSLQDVIDMTDSNHTLTILGDAKDAVNVPVVSGNYTVAKTNTGGFDVYTYSHAGDPTVVVKIDQDIQHS